MSLRGKLAVLLNRRKVDLDPSFVEELVQKYGVHSWFAYIVKERANRPDIWESAFWLANRLPSTAPILETGCGIASNLIWFAQQGFTQLYGTDIDDKLLGIAKELNEKTNSKIQLWHEDGLKPLDFPRSDFGAVISLNWTFLVDEFDIEEYLRTYHPHMAAGGYMVIDIIDEAYNQVENNQFLTSDLGKPEAERAPSEYRKRYSKSQVEQAASAAGFKVTDILGMGRGDKIPKYIYILQKI